MNLEKELEIYLRSRFTFIYVVTAEEERIVRMLKRLCEQTQRTLCVWDHADYFQQVVGTGVSATAKDPITALEAIEKANCEGVFLLRDFHQCWENQPRVTRKLKNLSQRLKYTKKTIIVVAPVTKVPEELNDECVVVEVPPPGVEDLTRILDQLLQSPNVRINLAAGDKERILQAALGLSSSQAQRIFAKAIVSHGVLDGRDIQLINEAKKQVIRQSGALEYFTASERISDVGGLDILKEWLGTRERAFSKEARAYGLPTPKGIALLGIPGTGKSLTAKMVASLWRLPLLRLDIGALFGSLVGESEENARKALSLAETVAPCVLWIDEIEKGLAVGGGDGGTSMRVFGTILSWLQEKKEPVFVVATANKISLLPPELLRRGRFDEIFFLDLPTTAERRAIFQVHLRKRGRSPENYDVDALAKAAEGYVGAEIEQAVIDAMYVAFDDPTEPGREFTTLDLLSALKKLVPMSRSQREIIEDLRQWLVEGRAQSASFKEADEAKDHFVPILLDPLGGQDGSVN